MLIDVNELPENSQIECDICIAGSGPAGITIAAELAGTPMRVCLVESGGLAPRAVAPASSVAEQRGVTIDPVKFQQHAFGGASSLWGGLRGQWFRLKPMEAVDFEARPWIANSGWPFPYQEFEPYFERAGRILRVACARQFAVDAHRRHLAPEFDNDELRTTIFVMAKPLRFGEHYHHLLASADNVRVYLHARVVEIEEDPGSPVVRHLRIATAGGKKHLIAAKQFVLACGGLENPRLLLASKGKTAAGVGNQQDVVGRYYMQHPKGLHGRAVLNHASAPFKLYTHGLLTDGLMICGGVAASEAVQRREGLLNHCIMFRPLFALSESHVSQAYWALHRAWHRTDGHKGGRREVLDLARFWASMIRRAVTGRGLRTVFSVLNHMEQIPKPESRLELSARKDRFGVNQLRVDWRIDPQEKASLRRLHELVRDRLAASGAGRLESQLEPLADDWPVAQDSAHHIGTTRMHEDPERGVTDPQCRVHGMRNLYISGSSVLPTSGHANPTLTVVALAVRLADHLKRLYGLNRP